MVPQQSDLFQEENWVEVGIGLAGLGRGRGSWGRGRGRTRAGRSQRRVIVSRSGYGKRSKATNSDRLGKVLTWKGCPRGRGGRKRGRRSIRSRQKSVKRAVEINAERKISKETIRMKSPKGFARNEWNGNETRFQVKGAKNASSSERSEFDDENGQATGDEYDDLVVEDYTGGFNGKSEDLLEGSDYNLANEDDEDDIDEGEDEDEQGDLDVEGYINGDLDEEGVRDGDGEQNGDQDDGTGSMSSDFSD